MAPKAVCYEYTVAQHASNCGRLLSGRFRVPSVGTKGTRAPRVTFTPTLGAPRDMGKRGCYLTGMIIWKMVAAKRTAVASTQTAVKARLALAVSCV